MRLFCSQGYETRHLDHVAIPFFQPKDLIHKKLSDLSKECHAAAAHGDTSSLVSLVAEIDLAAAKLWGITNSELKDAQDSLREMETGKRVYRYRKESSSNQTDDENE
jgi:hypothetical protein